MKAPLSLLLASSLALGCLPALAEEVVIEQVTTKHEADKDHAFDELLKENGGDLDAEHWANESIKELIQTYCGIMVGYPDDTFRGTRQMTRFEMAAALYKLMQCLQVQVAKVEIPDVDTSNLATKEDLAKVAALVKALRPELDALMASHLDLDKRLDALENIRISGGMQIRYRDRVMVTDGTDRNSPFFAARNSSPDKRVDENGVVNDRVAANEVNPLAFTNNINQFVRDQFGLPDQYHSPSDANVTVDDLAPMRSRTWLNVDVTMTDWLDMSTGIDLYDLGRASSGLSGVFIVSNGGHDLNEGLADGQAFVFRKASLNMHSQDYKHQLRFGLMSFSDLLNAGTGFTSLFDSGAWNGRDYGFVGWGGSDFALSNTAVTPYRNSLSRYWAGGLGASMVDPDSKKYNQVTSPGIAWRSEWNADNWGLSAMLGINGGSAQTNRAMAAAGNLSSGGPGVSASQLSFATSSLYRGAALQGLDRKGRLTGNNLALPSQYGDGYGVLGLEGRFFEKQFPVRVQLAAMNYLNDGLFDFNNPTRKEISATLDLGWNQNFGATVQVNKSFIGYDRHSLGLFFNNIQNSGFDVQLGANLATRGLFNLADLATGSAGVALGYQVWKGNDNNRSDLRVVLGVRQSLGDNFGAAPATEGALNQLFKDSGITVSVPWKNIHNSNFSLQAQYGMLMADALWQGRIAAQDIAVIGTYEF